MSSGGGSSEQTIGYKYYLGAHMALCHGPADKLVGIYVAGKTAWLGAGTGGHVDLDRPSLFGGTKREGGVSGRIDIEMGAPDQGANSYLAGRLGSDLMPAFRGVMCAVLRQVYIGTNPYLKDWGWLVQRILTRANGEEQWYPERAVINEYTATSGRSSTTSGVVYALVPNDFGWSYIYDPDYSLTSADIPDFGSSTAPFAGMAPPWPSWYPAFEVSLPNGLAFVQDAGTGGYTPVNGSAPGIHWAAKSIELEDLSPVYFSVAGNDGTRVFFDDVLWDGSPSITPASTSLKITIASENTGFPGAYMYFDAAVWQDTEVTTYAYEGTFSDMNPAHIIRECLTDTNWGMGYAESDIHDDSFAAAADTLYAEKMGISLLWSQQASLEDFVLEILRHIDAALYVDRSTGKFVLKLIRGGYDEEGLLVLNEGNVSRVESYSKLTMAELANEITVSYDSHETGQVETVTMQNLAMIQQQGAIIPASAEYMGFSNQATALKVAARDLKAVSEPLASVVLVANREAAVLNIGDVFRWEWNELDDLGAGATTSYIMRVVEIDFGDGIENAVRIGCVQDVFALPEITYATASDTAWEDPGAYPMPASPRLAMEAPFYELVRRLGEAEVEERLADMPEAGFLLVAAGRQGSEINAEIHTDAGAGYADRGMLDFCACTTLAQDIGQMDTEVEVNESADLDDFVENTLASIGSEIIVIESITDNVATIRRGCLDTVPTPHATDDPVVLWGESAAGDDVDYVDSESVAVKLLTINGLDVLPISDAPADTVTMAQRAIRPYPPADVTINAEHFPSAAISPISLAWAHRDRTQQTGGTVLGWTDAGVGPEAGTTYSAQLIRTDTEAVLDSFSGVSVDYGTLTSVFVGDVRLEVWSIRGGKECLQRVVHEFYLN